MKNQIILILIILCTTTIIAENPLSIEIPQGQSNLAINEYFPSIYVSELIKENQQVKSISVNEYGRTLGYVNVLGGIGVNFLIEPNKNYEIYSNQTITIYLKN